ncbi:ABC transporter ATP-binding protein [Chloroflexota bacterium]
MHMGSGRRMFGEETSKPQDTGVTLRRFAVYFRPYWLILLLVVAMMIGSTYVQVLGPSLIGQVVDCYLAPAVTQGMGPAAMQQLNTDEAAATTNCWYTDSMAGASAEELIAGMGGLVLLLILLYVIGAVLSGGMFYAMRWAGGYALKQMRVDVFNQIHRLTMGYFDRQEAGDLMARVTSDANAIEQAFGFALVQVASGLMLVVWIIWTMFRVSPAYALLSLLMVPVMVLVTLWFSRQARKAFRTARAEMGSVNADLQEGIAAVREVQAFSREDENIEQFRESNAANRDANIKAVAYTSALQPTLEALGYVSMALVVGVGGLVILGGGTLFGSVISLGLVIAFLGYVQRLNQPIVQISAMWTNVQNAIAGGERIFQLLDVESEIQDKPDARTVPEIQGRVELVDVYAEYNPGEPVLQGVSLTAEPGQTIAIVGPTGAGKTTIINLLPRFYDVTAGAVKVDGYDVRDVRRDSLREQIGIVLQDTFLFSTSVMDNIRYGQPDATDDEVIAAAQLAHADTFIERLPEGYQTVLGERGAGLSQGQRQLLSIARAALSDPRILILDEATSSVDTRTERLIQEALAKLLVGRTSFVIAHRLSTIRNADQVLVVDDGRIIEHGTHTSLLEAQGAYYDLYMSQFRRQAVVSGGNGASPNGQTAPEVKTGEALAD